MANVKSANINKRPASSTTQSPFNLIESQHLNRLTQLCLSDNIWTFLPFTFCLFQAQLKLSSLFNKMGFINHSGINYSASWSERELEAVFDCKHNFYADFLANFAFGVSTTIFASPLQRSQSISGYLIHLFQSQKAPVIAVVLSESRTSNRAKQPIKTLKSVIKRSGWWKSIPLHHLWLLFFFF